MVTFKGATAVTLFFAITTGTLWAHQHHPHHKTSHPMEATALQKINAGYLQTVKPIFQAKCFDCHSDQTRFPWYSKFPGAKQLIESDIQEARKHLDFSSDFPFKGHGSPQEDLEEILRTVNSGEMPPLRYRILHPRSKMTSDETTLIQKWVAESQKLLE